MSKPKQFNPAQFGLQGKRLAMIDFNRFIGALVCIHKHGEERLLITLRDDLNFKAIPIIYKGERLSIVELEKAEDALKYIRENAKQELLDELKAEHELELVPIVVTESHSRKLYRAILKHALGVAAAMAVLHFAF